MGGIVAVIPVKQRMQAKQRLAGVLTARQRARLVACMLHDVLAALAQTRGLAGVVVVTADAAVARLAARYGAGVVSDGAAEGQNAAVLAGRRHAAAHGQGGVLVLPGDIPGVTAAELEAVLAAHRPAPAFTIVPSHDGNGSNAVLCAPAAAVAPCFGAGSFAAHLAAARTVGIVPSVLRLPGIAHDIDHPADLLALARRRPRSPTHTWRYMARLALLQAAAAAGEDTGHADLRL